MKKFFSLKNTSLMTKIVLSNIICVMLLIVCISFLSVYLFSKITNENENFRQYVSEKTSSSIISTISDINSISILIVSDSHILNYLTSDNISDNLRLYNYAKDSLNKFYFQNNFISDIYIETESGKSLHCDVAKSAFFTPEEIENMNNSIGGWFWSSRTTGQTAMYRVIRDSPNDYAKVAYLKIVINPDAFLKVFHNNLLSGIEGFAFLMRLIAL